MIKVDWVDWSEAVPSTEGWYLAYWLEKGVGTIETIHLTADSFDEDVFGFTREDGTEVVMTHWAELNIAPPDTMNPFDAGLKAEFDKCVERDT